MDTRRSGRTQFLPQPLWYAIRKVGIEDRDVVAWTERDDDVVLHLQSGDTYIVPK